MPQRSLIDRLCFQSEASRLPDLIIAAILLCCVARKYKQQRDLNGPPSWAKTQTKIRYQAVSNDDVEDQQSDRAASDDVSTQPPPHHKSITRDPSERWLVFPGPRTTKGRLLSVREQLLTGTERRARRFV